MTWDNSNAFSYFEYSVSLCCSTEEHHGDQVLWDPGMHETCGCALSVCYADPITDTVRP